jgi:hypothetical protein
MDYLYFCCLTAMQNRNEFSSNIILPLALTALLFVFLYSTVKSSDLVSNKDYFISGSFNTGSALYSSKENHFSVAKKQKLENPAKK